MQIGSRFAATHEASSHLNFKKEILRAQEGDTELTLRELTPVRLLKNAFYEQIQRAYQRGATVEDLKKLLGKGGAGGGREREQKAEEVEKTGEREA